MKSTLNLSKDFVVPDVSFFMKEEIKHLQSFGNIVNDLFIDSEAFVSNESIDKLKQ